MDLWPISLKGDGMNVNSHYYYGAFGVKVRLANGDEEVCRLERATADLIGVTTRNGYKIGFKRPCGECVSGHGATVCDLENLFVNILVADGKGAYQGIESALSTIEEGRKKLAYWQGISSLGGFSAGQGIPPHAVRAEALVVITRRVTCPT